MSIAVINSLDREGRGVTRVDGKMVFIEEALPGERVAYRTRRKKPTYEHASVEQILRESAARVAPRCTYFGVCGGCAMQHLDMRSQVAVKQRLLEDLFVEHNVRPERMLPAVYGESWGYRHRARLSVRLVPKKGGVLVGFRERRSSYVADMRSCEILPPHVSALISPLRALIGKLSIVQRLPQVEVAVGAAVTVLVLRILEPLQPTDEALLRSFADEHGIQFWLQPHGPESAAPFYPLDAPPLYYDLPEFGVRIDFLPTDFTQVNHAINAILVRRAIGLLDPQPGERIVDLFCGLGNFTLPIASRGAEVLGIEGHAGLVERARENAAKNGLKADFQAANLFERGDWAQSLRADKLLIDPPRDGAIEVVKALDEAAPRRIVYVACEPSTLARDAAVLVHTKGYQLKAAGIVNMFPHTAHVESMALFER